MTALERQKALCIIELTDAIYENDLDKAQTAVNTLNILFQDAEYYQSEFFGSVNSYNANQTFVYILTHGNPFINSAHLGEAIVKLLDIIIIGGEDNVKTFLTYEDIVDFIEEHQQLIQELSFEVITILITRFPAGEQKVRLNQILKDNLETEEIDEEEVQE